MLGCSSHNEEWSDVSEIGATDFVEEDSVCIVDSIAIDSAAFVDMFMPAEEPDIVGRYAIYSEKGKFGIYDSWLKENVTSAEFDELRYAQRVEGVNQTNTFFNMKMGKDIGSVCVNEEDNECEIQILATFP
jgi:hypothetical protein